MMSFLSPTTFLLLIPLGAGIVLLYLLKLKRKEKLVSSVMLWRDAAADIQANVPFQKLKKSLLLILQLLALLALVAAVARPFVRTEETGGSRIVAILDTSASMQSTDVSPSRFSAAKSKALDMVDHLGPTDTMLVMTAGSKARVVASFTSDRKALSDVISSLQPTDAQCNMRQAVVLALSLVAGKCASPPRVVVLSDGGFAEMTDLSPGDVNLDFVCVGKRCDNAAITGLDSRRTPSGDTEVFIGLANFSERRHSFNLEVHLGDQLLDIREETLEPGETRQEILKDLAKLDGRVTATIDASDDLAADNSGWVYLTRPRSINCLLVTKGNVFLQNALNLDRRTSVSVSDSVPADLAEQDYDMVVFDGVRPPKSLPPGGYLLINTSCAAGPASMSDSVDTPTIIDYDRRHPASAYVDFSGVKIASSAYLKPKSWASAIVEGRGGVLGAAGEKDGRSFVQLGFDLLETDFPMRVGFPIFVANCLDYLAPNGQGGSGRSLRTGEPVYIDVPPSAKKLTVTKPGGSKRVLSVTRSPVLFDDTERCGVYTVKGKDIDFDFACNLSSSDESQCAPKNQMVIGGTDFQASASPAGTNRELYGVLIIVTLVLLTFEWYAYHRRL